MIKKRSRRVRSSWQNMPTYWVQANPPAGDNSSPMEINIPPPSTSAAMYSTPLAGMQRARSKAVHAATDISNGDHSPKRFVDLMSQQRTYEANAEVLRSMDEQAGHLLNTLA